MLWWSKADAVHHLHVRIDDGAAMLPMECSDCFDQLKVFSHLFLLSPPSQTVIFSSIMCLCIFLDAL